MIPGKQRCPNHQQGAGYARGDRTVTEQVGPDQGGDHCGKTVHGSGEAQDATHLGLLYAFSQGAVGGDPQHT